MSTTVQDSQSSRVGGVLRNWSAAWDRVGEQTEFYFKTLRSTGDAVRHYPTEILRLVASMSLGNGALALIGGTIVVVGFLTLSAGALIAVQGYNLFTGIGVEALTGFVSAYLNVRVIAPLGVLLPNGLGLKIDDTDIGRAGFVKCLPSGCVAEVTMDEKLIDQLKNGGTATYIIHQTPDEGIGLPLTLGGFKDGFAKLP